MNDKIEVEEYVRTKKKGIFKVLSIRQTPYGYYCGTVDNDKIKTFTIGKGGNAEIKNDIVKHSKNIIDLIEVGDIVTYWIDTQSYNGWVKNFVDIELLKEMKENFIEEDIKSIVTKEVFASAEYRVETD